MNTKYRTINKYMTDKINKGRFKEFKVLQIRGIWLNVEQVVAKKHNTVRIYIKEK